MIQNNRFNNVEYHHLININDDDDLDTNKQYFCEVTDVFCSVATFLDTTDLTRFFSISRTFFSSLSDLPEIKQILLYNRSQKRRNWKLLGKYDYNNYISRQRIKNSGLIGAHYIQKSNEVLTIDEFRKNTLWSIEGGTQVLMCGAGLYILLSDCFLFSSRHYNLDHLCISLFNQTHMCDSKISNITTFLLDKDLPKISFEEQFELKTLNYLKTLTGERIADIDFPWYSFWQPLVTSFSFISPILTNPNLYIITAYRKTFDPQLICNFLNFSFPCLAFWVPATEDKDLSDINDNDIIFKSMLIYQSLNFINFLNTVVIFNRPYLRKKIAECASEKIKRIFSSISFYEPRLIKKIRYNTLTLGEIGLIKIKSTFQYIGSYLSTQNRIHRQNN